jgi:hypothetical protein
LHPEGEARPAVTYRRTALRGVALVVVVVTAAYGLVLRAWVLTHVPLNSDQAVVGLMAKSILAGHFNTFYWGQQYGGAETYPVAAVLWLVHGSPTGVGATAALLSAVAAALVGLIVSAVTANRWLGAVAGAGAWVWPYAVVWNSLRETGFRAVCLICGLLLVYLAALVHRGRGGVAVSLLLGLAAGVGWWASPEISYFAVPAGVLLLASWDRPFAPAGRWAAPWQPGPALAAVGGAVVGALPWLYTNLHTGFASLSTGSLPTYEGIGYGGRLGVFFRAMLPVQLGVRSVPDGNWVGGATIGPVLYGLALAVVVAALVRAALLSRGGRRAAPALAAAGGVLAFPFVYALVPSSGYWLDGRYGVELPSLLVLLGAVVLAGPSAVQSPGAAGRPAEGGRARHARRRRSAARPAGAGPGAVTLACAGLLAATLLTVAAARAGGVPANPRTFGRGWGDPDAPLRQVAAGLTAHGIRDAYGDYWTAYVLDFIDPKGAVVSPSPLDVVRWPATAAAVGSAPDPAWLFFDPNRLTQATEAFGNTEQGPGNYTEAQFTALLTGRGVAYRVVHLGVLDAVVPARRVTLPRG